MGCSPLQRAVTYPFDDPIFKVSWYSPGEVVSGSARPLPLPRFRAARSPISSGALRRVVRYARENNSCALLVLLQGQVLLERYWCGLGPRSLANTMSMSKTVVALLLGIAIEEGAVRSASDEVAGYLPQWAGDERRKITIEHLLQMTSGLRNSSSKRNPLSQIALVHLGTDAVRKTLSVPAVSPPGRTFDYNNLNTQVLSILLERATGWRYGAYLSRRLWAPLGASPARVWLDRPGGTAKTYCCLLATAQDWARVGLLMMNGGRVGERQVVPAGWIRRMLSPSRQEENYGYHVWLGHRRGPRRSRDWSEPFVAPDTFIIMGQEEQRVYVVPSRHLVVVRLGRDAENWDDPYLPNTLIRGMRQSNARQPWCEHDEHLQDPGQRFDSGR